MQYEQARTFKYLNSECVIMKYIDIVLTFHKSVHEGNIDFQKFTFLHSISAIFPLFPQVFNAILFALYKFVVISA